MKSVTITLGDDLVRRARIAAIAEGQSLSRFICKTVVPRGRRPLTQKEALDIFLAGPLMHLTDDDGKAPSRDQLNGQA